LKLFIHHPIYIFFTTPRVFSRVKEIRETCSDALYEDMLEIRVLQVCNGNLSELTK
jgi:hypothetical protein